LDFRLLLFRQIELGERAQPGFGDLRVHCLRQEVEALEDMAEHPVEGVEMALVLDESGARQVVKVLNLALGTVALEPLDQGQVLLQGDRQLGGLERVEKGGEHAEGRAPGSCSLRKLPSETE